MAFKIALLAAGVDPAFWDTLESLEISDPDFTFQPFAEVIETLAGTSYGRGFAIATWSWAALHNAQRKILRTYCPTESGIVYITTPINEDDSGDEPIFKDFLGIAHWNTGQENKQALHTLEFDLTIDHLVEVV